MANARKDSWKIQPMPPETTVLEYSDVFTLEEHERIARGLVPRGMEDKWFAYLDGTTLSLHRSWTGFCVYQVELAREGDTYRVRRALVNRDARQSGGSDDAYDVKLLRFLIHALLLGRQAVFPLPSGLSKSIPAGAYQHHICGKAFPESEQI